MSAERAITHVVQCFDPSGARWGALCEAPFEHKALVGWAPGAPDGADPPEPVRHALWLGLRAAGSGPTGFAGPREALGPGSLWRDTGQGWLAKRFRALPGTVWTGDAETFDAAFGPQWSAGRQVLFAIGADTPVPKLDEALLAPWLEARATVPAPLPPGVRVAVRAGVDGGLFAAFGIGRAALERFIDGFRQGLDWRTTTFQRVCEHQMGPTIQRLSAGPARQPDPGAPRWFAAS